MKTTEHANLKNRLATADRIKKEVEILEDFTWHDENCPVLDWALFGDAPEDVEQIFRRAIEGAVKDALIVVREAYKQL